ncbi:MAG: helical backbone metal receptor [Ferruginibacter sp.]
MILLSTDELNFIPQRIVSLVPSQTELLYTLGLESETVGITKFCIHPKKWFSSKTRVGGTKSIKKEIIDQLQPQLIIANKEENVQEQIEALAEQYPVWVSDVNNLSDALQMITDIGRLTGKENESNDLRTNIETEFAALNSPSTAPQHNHATAYLIWRKPYMTIGGDTFINDMLEKCGFRNIFIHEKRYPQITTAQLKAIGCQLLLLSSEPYPFKQKHIDELQEQLPDTRIILVDGEMFSWYGSRLLQAPAYFKKLKEQCLSFNL